MEVINQIHLNFCYKIADLELLIKIDIFLN
jgi:hypothetical protein